MMPLSALRSVARQCLAAVAMFGFSLNVATPTIAHGCAHLPPAGMTAAAGGSAHHGHESVPPPTDQSAHGKKCQCIGHSCGTALALPTPVAAGPRLVPAITQSELVYSADRLPAVVQHLLPFAVGPPTSPLA